MKMSDNRRGPSLARAVAAPAAAGLLARLVLIAWTSPLQPSLDENRFWDLATSRLEGTAFLPPLAPAFLAMVRAVFGDSLTMARIVMACLSVASIVLVFVLAERHLGAGRSAAWVAALVPTLVYYDGRLRSEPLVALLLLGFAVLWTRPGGRRSSDAFGAGIVLGLAALARPEFLVLPFVLALLSVSPGPARPRGREWILLAAGIGLLIVPWSIRSHGETGDWVLVSANGGYNFWKSFNAATDGSQVVPFDDAVWRDVSGMNRAAFGYTEGWRFIRAHPVWSLALAPLKVGHLFGPERDFLSDLKRAAFPARLRALDLAFAIVQNFAWFLLFAGGLLALCGPRRTEVKAVALSVILTLVLVHLVFFGDDRFHVPAVVFLCALLPEAWRERLWTGSRWRVRTVALLALLEGVFWSALLVRDASRISELWSRL